MIIYRFYIKGKELIRNRNPFIIFFFSGNFMDDAIFMDCFKVLIGALSHKLTEPWEFEGVKGDGLKRLRQFKHALQFYNLVKAY